MIAAIALPVLVTLIVQVATFPSKAHHHEVVNEVMFSFIHFIVLVLLIMVMLIMVMLIMVMW